MPPLVLEIGVAIAMISALVKTTTTINRIENQQRIGHVELIGKHEILRKQLEFLEKESVELKLEMKELRRRRHTDPDTGFN